MTARAPYFPFHNFVVIGTDAKVGDPIASPDDSDRDSHAELLKALSAGRAEFPLNEIASGWICGSGPTREVVIAGLGADDDTAAIVARALEPWQRQHELSLTFCTDAT